MKKCSIYSLFVLYIFSLFMMEISVKGNPKCYKRLPSITTENCCSLPNFYTAEIKEKCTSNADHFKLDREHKHLCFISCAFDEIGVFNQEKFQKEILESYLNVALQNSVHMKDNIKTYFKKCIQSYEQLGEMIPKQGACALYPTLVMDCVFIKTFKECPDSNWSNTDGCNEIRDHWRQCLPVEF